MIESIYLDSNLFIWGYNFSRSNSAKILEFVMDSDIEIYMCEKVIDELRQYFCTYFNKDIFSEIRLMLFCRCNIIYNEDIKDELEKWKNKIKRKDLEHIAIIKKLNIPILVSYDRDFEAFPEYMTPKKFVKYIGLKQSKTEY